MGEFGRWSGLDLSSMTPQDIYLNELGRGVEQIDPRTDEERREANRRNNEKMERYREGERHAANADEKEGILTRWNAVGQYARINDFCLPFRLRHEDYTFFPERQVVRGIEMWKLPIGLTTIPLEDSRRCYLWGNIRYIYRAIDASDVEVWEFIDEWA